MNKLKSYIIGFTATIAIACGLASCQDHFDAPNMGSGPEATMTANTTIAEVKDWLWRSDLNYCDTVYTRDYYLGNTDDPWEGEHIVISGRVISSDYAGNCFKYIVLQDETGALNFSINSYNLYLYYRRGQEILVDLTGMFMGKYRGLEQVGFPSTGSTGSLETSFMGPEMFNRQRELNGWPKLAEIDTIQISSFSELGTSPADLQKWQSQLIRINNVTFTQSSDAAAEGITTLSTYHSSGVTQTIVASDGSTGAVRTSGYANFWNMPLPEKPVDVVLLVGYYGSTESNAGYQFTLIDAASIITDATIPKGTKDNPYTIGEVLDFIADESTTTTGWVSGYIVGTVAPEVTTINSNDDVEWTADPILGETMVIGPTADCTDVAQCLVIELNPNTAIYKESILANPSNYKKEIAIRGTFQMVMGNAGVVTPGSNNDYQLEGQQTADGNGTQANPYTCSQIIAMNPSSTTEAVQSGVWVSGYIVGWYDNNNKEWNFSASSSALTTNLLLSDDVNTRDASKCIDIQLTGASFRDDINLAANPGVLGKMLAIKGDIMKYNTMPGVKNLTDYALSGETKPQTIFSETFGSSQGDFTIENTTLPEGLTYVWAFASGYGMKASAFANNTNYAADSWLISPEISLAGTSSPVLSFSHVVNYFANLATAQSEVSVNVRVGKTGSWTKLDIPQWSTNSDWNFVNSGNIDLSAYKGQTIQIGFHYTSTASKAGTWEVKNVAVAEGVPDTGGSTPGTPDTPDTPGGVMTVADALNYIAQGGSSEATVQVKGLISDITEISTSFGNATYAIKDNLNDGNALVVYRGYWLGGQKFTSESQLEIGAEVIVEGKLVNYNGTYEFTTGNTIVSYNGQTSDSGSGDGGDSGTTTPPTEGSLTETFNSSIGLPSQAPTTPTEYTSSATGIKYTLQNCYVTSYMMVKGKDNTVGTAYFSWTLPYACSALTLTTTSGCSENPASQINLYANGTKIGTYDVNKHDYTLTIDIPAEHQAAGTVYKIESNTNKYNQQIAKLTYVKQ